MPKLPEVFFPFQGKRRVEKSFRYFQTHSTTPATAEVSGHQIPQEVVAIVGTSKISEAMVVLSKREQILQSSNNAANASPKPISQDSVHQ